MYTKKQKIINILETEYKIDRGIDYTYNNI